MISSITLTRWVLGSPKVLKGAVSCVEIVRVLEVQLQSRLIGVERACFVDSAIGSKWFLLSGLQATIGIDFLSKTMYLEDRTVRLQLW